ncbi:hypothetical protein ACT6P6_25675, partial [Priestia endophytica]
NKKRCFKNKIELTLTYFVQFSKVNLSCAVVSDSYYVITIKTWCQQLFLFLFLKLLFVLQQRLIIYHEHF